MNATANAPAEFFTIAPELPRALTPPGVLEVFPFPLTVDESTLSRLRSLLSPDERARADRLRDPAAGARFTAARGAMRVLLGHRLGRPPQALEFVYGTKGKPAVADTRLRFNLSHSGDLAVLALMLDQAVGVDVERVRENIEFEKLARRFFAPAEVEAIVSLPENERLEAFFSCWTRKEAYMKAVGDGFAVSLKAFRVSVRREAPPALLDVRSNPEECSRWRLVDLDCAAGYRACAAVEAPLAEVRQFQLRWV